jgi:hypothetical protein
VKPTIRQIQETIAAKRHISVRAIKGPCRTPKLVRTRHDAIYLARRLTGHSYTTIGKHFGGRDHTSIIHAYRKVQDRIHRNQKTRVALAALIDQLTFETHERTLRLIDDRSAQKALVMNWWERREIAPEHAESLIRELHLEAA